jgi:para-nitrobenzyl esterase
MKKQKEVPDSPSPKAVSRRTLIKSAAAVAAGTAASALAPSQLVPQAEAQTSPGPFVATPTTIEASPRKNIVETDRGKVYGFAKDGVVTFRGIPYGASTEGKNRFMPPMKPEAWAGVRSALYWGPVSPQPFTSTLDSPRAGWKHDREAFMFEWEDGHDSEDCLRINIWTPSINDNAKRPVMVWLHGGGYVFGSDQELRMYPGDGLVRRGDVVVASVNHRLGVLGFGNLMTFGEQYARSPNVGMLDIVAALEWVKTNIGNFGGDPNRILIFGQSGGGGKVSTLMGMPAAQGLFHRAVVESGSILQYGSEEASARVMAGVVAELGLSKGNIGKIQEIPYQHIIEAAVRSQRVSASEGGDEGILSWGPVEDGKILPFHTWNPDAPSFSKDVPLIVGNTLNEFFNSVQMEDASVDSWSMAEVQKQLSAKPGNSFLSVGFGEAADRVIDVCQKVYPAASPFSIYSILSAMRSMRLSALAQATRKATQGGAPAYNYLFTWQTPVLDGQARAFHCSELPFVFYQTEVCAAMTGGGPDALALGARMADAWISFARTGNPNHPGLPHWRVYDPEKVPTMIFDDQCVVKNDPDGEIRKAIVEAMA